MRSSLLLSAVLVPGLAFGSCDASLSEPEQSVAEATPTFNFTNNPDAGPRILRWEDSWGQYFPLEFADVTLALGFDPLFICDGGWEFDTWAVQDIFFKNNPERMSEVWKGDGLTASLWPGVMWDFDCAFFQESTPIGVGTAHLRGTYNDYNGEFYEHNHATKWGGFAKATLYSPAGKKMNFIYHGTCVWNDQHVDGKCNDKVNLTP
jgi:hypothetical protein